ncbi:hypothetical protein JL101_006805 [Skermanella rosea]|uniref:hypothetical protein n=1 Tax=Skermanella rosea TaxID=1817965 RepID=UPI001931E8E4|nr:hypothetical protein [Skermanella rosea]UEM05141.1 hypothetical protein JL101_006805 [Skermanella rosea]
MAQRIGSAASGGSTAADTNKVMAKILMGTVVGLTLAARRMEDGTHDRHATEAEQVRF